MFRLVAIVALVTSTALMPLLDSKGYHLLLSNKSTQKIPDAIKVVYYPVWQATPDGLKRAIASHGPLDVLGVRRAALFSWKIDWNWAEVEPGKIDLKASSYRVEYFLTLPSVLNGPLNDSEQSRWDTYVSGLVNHELVHYLNADQCSGEIGLELDRMALHGRVAEKSQVFSAVSGVLKECSRRDLEFDFETNHGLRDGAVLSN